MKPVENKKHRMKYFPIDLYHIDVNIFCDVGDGVANMITRHIPLSSIMTMSKGNVCRTGAEVRLGTIIIEPKWFKSIRKRKE